MYGQPWSMYVPQTYPSLGGVQLAPQGFWGNLLGQFAGPAGQAFGGLFGQPQIGGQMGQALLACAARNPRLQVVGQIDLGDDIRSVIESADVVVDFSFHKATHWL